ncbi:MAG: RnfABCDGE type electron transport complex subunit G [Clostridiales bacterium]|nr:RnfABCDGE type electron transport complex subunit G [Clostridiales bacterium]
MSTFGKDFVKPILVLSLICLVISAALAFTNQKTAPIIAEAERVKAEEARKEMLPQADSFTKMELEGLPATVTEVYKADNGAGFVFMLTAKGYGGDIKLICGIDSEGKITDCNTLSQSETKGLGTKITQPEFRSQFSGKDSSLEGVETISGATISSKAFVNAIKDAFTAYKAAKEAE